eukprot:Mycagemm_TRINITY_DN10317_c2_g1::TRINITY_DN10317_c2_g1_i17::g.876::m.876 type:complete len:343 gc:universal TRINITY_DN10317_c2_g1_i17:1031-3(-)
MSTSIEETEAHVLLTTLSGLGLLLLLLLLCGGLASGGLVTTLGGRSGGSGEGARVLKVLLNLLSALEGDLGGDSNREDVLVRVDDKVRDSSSSRERNRETSCGDVTQPVEELCKNVSVGEVENLGTVDGASVVDHAEDHAVGERLDVELGEESSLRLANLVALLQEEVVILDLDLALVDLGGNVERLEERSLGGLETGGASGDNDFVGSEGADLGRGLNAQTDDLVLHSAQIALGEHKADVATDVRHQLLKASRGRVLVLVEVATDSLADHGVLAHENDSLTAERNANALHVCRANIVGLNDEDLVVLLEELNKLDKVGLLLRLGIAHYGYCAEGCVSRTLR